MSESVGIRYINTRGNRTNTGKNSDKNLDEAHVDMDAGGTCNMYESLNKQKIYSEEYDTLKVAAKPVNETRRSGTENVTFKATIYVLVAVNVMIVSLSITGFAVVLNKVSNQSDRMEIIEAHMGVKTAKVHKQINKTVAQKDITKVEGQRVAFTATGVNGSDPLIFPDIIYNLGGSYNSKNGVFTCTVAAIYHFASTLTKEFGSDVDMVACFINVNSREKIGAVQDPYNTDDDKDGYSITLSGTFYLNTNDTVYISCDYGASALSNTRWCSFTGFLVTIL